MTKVLHYAVSIFLGAVYSSEVALEFSKAELVVVTLLLL